ncbi:MAG: DcaP family trimeric outer membrane transporter [Bacteriovoracaceae bacterium]
MNRNKLIVGAGLILAGTTAFAQDKANEKKFEVYGFTQADYIQDFKRVDPAWESTLRPSKIPTQTGQFGSNGQAIISVKQSRFGVKGALPVENQVLNTKFEFDLFGVGPDQGQTTIRLRHAYGEYGHWLAGQTNSLFMDGDVFPNQIDYWGPAGMVFLRTPQIRYNFLKGANEFAVAIEHATNDIDPGNLRVFADNIGVTTAADEKLPDVTLMSRINRDWGHLQGSAIVRSIGFETLGGSKTNEPKSRQTGYGLNISSHINVGTGNKIRWNVVYGRGIASYMNDGGTDLAAAGSLRNPRADTVPLLGMTLFYDHMWNERASTAIGYSTTQVENTSLQAANAFHKGEYALVNYLYKPAKNITVGGELLWGGRQDKNGDYGTDTRTQISFKYDFSSLDFL